MSPSHCPDRGDIVWLNLDPQAGHEQGGRRPTLVLTPKKYNQKVGLAICCPITSQIKGYPFEVSLPEGNTIHGRVLADHIKSLDWKERQSDFICRVPDKVLMEVIGKLWAVLG